MTSTAQPDTDRHVHDRESRGLDGTSGDEPLSIPTQVLTVVTVVTVDGQPLGASSPQLRSVGGFGNVTWQLVGGQMPPGLTFGSDGAIRGRSDQRGRVSLTVRATDSDDPATFADASVTLVVR